MKIKSLILIMAILSILSCQKEENANPKTNELLNDVLVENVFANAKGVETTIEYLGQKAKVIDIGDYYIFQGDILINKAEYEKNKSKLKGAAVNNRRWNYQYNRVAYVINSNLPDQQRVIDAINHIEANTHVDFVRRTTQPDYIEIVYSNSGTYSTSIGKNGGRQEIGLADWAEMGNVAHEFLHALGAFHEHTRQDRDSHINVHWNNIGSSAQTRYQYEIYSLHYSGFDHGNFDFNSIMLYPSSWNSSTNGWTMTDNNGNPFNAQRNGLSAGDIALMNHLYPPIPPSVSLKVTKTQNNLNSVVATYGFTTSHMTGPIEVLGWYGKTGQGTVYYDLHSTNNQCNLILMKVNSGGSKYHYMKLRIKDSNGRIYEQVSLYTTSVNCTIMALMPPPPPF